MLILILVAALYDFAAAGAGQFTFTPIAKFLVDSLAGKETFSKAAHFFKAQAASVNSVDVELQGEIKREAIALNTRAVDICTTEPDRSFINSRFIYSSSMSVVVIQMISCISYIEAKDLATMASTYVNSTGANDTLYTTYFGATPITEVITTLDAVAAEDSTNRT